MKLNSIFITGALALSCGSLQALDTAAPRADKMNPQQSFTELAGIQVWNLQDELLGRIKFVTADLENAQLVEVVIASGGFFGLGGKLTSAPPRAFKLDESKQVMRLDVSKARFEAAPVFKTSNVAAYSQAARVAAVSRYYGQQPWFHSDAQGSLKNARIPHLGHVERTDHIMGMQIKNTNGQYLGRVGSLMMDLPTGQIVHVVDETAAMAGNGRYIIQARALRYNAKHSGLVLDKSYASLKKEPRLKWVGDSRQSFRKESTVNSKAQTN
ncbi:MAG: PRC-barrel domain-containing protein [Prosthecobacter sp.]|uniref:PRC-barrel domain-containing protein n=1 Tax=Prosthecobacter sp. TaxID=1965333 RepID=UPI0025EE97B9|nr:PRC-barrel domain-containing protein [Prosthecobacter sp.]MCF7785478.1 PRC-barrel domain-containing protein [Prosthecobacter sp.]